MFQPTHLERMLSNIMKEHSQRMNQRRDELGKFTE